MLSWALRCTYPPTSSSQPRIYRSPPGTGGADQVSSGGRWRWPRVSGPRSKPPGSWCNPSPASCGTAIHPSPRSLTTTLRGVHPDRSRTRKTSPHPRGALWRACSLWPFSHWFCTEDATMTALRKEALLFELVIPPHPGGEPNFTHRPETKSTRMYYYWQHHPARDTPMSSPSQNYRTTR